MAVTLADLSQLLASLNQWKSKSKDDALYQVVKQLISLAQQNFSITNDNLNTQNGKITNINNATVLTAGNEIATFPQSRQLLAGTGITFDDTVANKRTINSTGSGTTLVPMTTGAIPGQILFIGSEVMLTNV